MMYKMNNIIYMIWRDLYTMSVGLYGMKENIYSLMGY